MLISYDVGTVIKRPGTPEEEPRLEREQALLAEARHAGVVTLLDAGRDEQGPWLRLEDAGGVTIHTMLRAGAPGLEQTLLPLLASVATTVADLHDIGIAHGAIDASHVLVDRSGHALLCSFGRGGHVGQVGDKVGDDVQVDVAGMATLAAEALGAQVPPELASVLEEARATGRTSVSARQLANALASAAAAAAGGRPWPSASSRVLRPRVAGPYAEPRRLPVKGLIAAAAVLLVLAAVTALSFGRGRHRHGPPAPAGRGVLAGAVPFVYRDGVLSFAGQRFTVGEPGDHLTVGRWYCAQPEVALLRPGGSIYVFDALAKPGVDQEARLVARAPGAAWMGSRPDSRVGCDVIVVGDAKGSAIVRPPAA